MIKVHATTEYSFGNSFFIIHKDDIGKVNVS
jgi:hypothetical protein